MVDILPAPTHTDADQMSPIRAADPVGLDRHLRNRNVNCRHTKAMPMPEGPEEVRARKTVEGYLGVSLTHADTHGGVDYRFADLHARTGAVEVTTVTSEKAKKAHLAWRKVREQDFLAPSLATSWLVMLDDARVRYRGLRERIEPALASFESAHENEYSQPNSFTLMRRRPGLGQAISMLDRAGVEAARAVTTRDPTQPRLILSPGTGGTASGSADALGQIETVLRLKPDNEEKLRVASVDDAHLFVWLDSDTPYAISRPFQGGPVDNLDYFGLPGRDPDIADHVDTFWIVHAVSRRGWRWRRDQGWDGVEAHPRQSDQA